MLGSDCMNAQTDPSLFGSHARSPLFVYVLAIFWQHISGINLSSLTRCMMDDLADFMSFSTVWMDGWMTCDFTSFSTVFQSYQDDERLIMKGCVQWSSVYG